MLANPNTTETYSNKQQPEQSLVSHLRISHVASTLLHVNNTANINTVKRMVGIKSYAIIDIIRYHILLYVV